MVKYDKENTLSDSSFFTIIIPTYNRASFLTKTIESVLQQSFRDWELIIIDDGSTDTTKNIIRGFTDKRIKYFYQKNQERSVARNKGIEHAEGQYICFLDSDDYYLPQHLENFHSTILKAENKTGFFYCGICFEQNGVIRERVEVQNTFADPKEFVICAVIGTPQVCIHRSVLKKEKFNPQFTIGEDMELWIRIADDFPPVFSKHYTVVALEHNGRSVNNHILLITKMKEMVYHIFSAAHPGNKISQKAKHTFLSDYYFRVARSFIHRNEKFQSIRFLLKSILIKTGHRQTLHKIYLILLEIPLVSKLMNKQA